MTILLEIHIQIEFNSLFIKQESHHSKPEYLIVEEYNPQFLQFYINFSYYFKGN